MCQMCMRHGANGKWYLNARNYLKEAYEKGDSADYLEDLWGNIERAYLRKVFGVLSLKWMSTKTDVPVLGPLLKWYAQHGFEKEKRLRKSAWQGHYGQVLTLDESKTIVLEKAQFVAKAICPCKYLHRGIKEAKCLGFTPFQEVLRRLPRFVPENGVEILDGDQAASFLEECSDKGYVHSIWTGPTPAIVALCSCDLPTCGVLRLRAFDVKACMKGECVAVVNPSKCVGCEKCTSRCQFGAINFSPSMNRVNIEPAKCFGCGNCSDVCEEKAINLIDRNEIPVTRGMY